MMDDISAIKDRNARVERDKAWEQSYTRRFLICVITYICAALVMHSMNVARPFLSAIIPPLGYYLSTLSLPLVKHWWLQKFYSRAFK